MPSLDFRLASLEKRRPPRAPRAGSSFDPARLTAPEWEELDGILAPFATAPLDRMTDAHLDRAVELTRKAEGQPLAPAHVGMRHRDPAIGPCRCVACARQPTPTDDDGRPDPAA